MFKQKGYLPYQASLHQNSYDWSLVLLYKTQETGACCTKQHLNGSVFLCYTKQEINMALKKYKQKSTKKI